MSGIMRAENWIDGLPAPIRDSIRGQMTIVELDKGAILKRAGDPPDAVFQVESGYMRLLGLHEDGRQVLMVIYQPGNSFGETPIFGDRSFNHTTIAMTPVRLRRLSRTAFWELFNRHPEIPAALCRKLDANTGRALAHRELRVTRRLRSLIASVLVNIAEQCGEIMDDGETRIPLPLTQWDIAEHLEVTRQAVQREIGAMKAAGLLSKRDGRWHLASLEALRLF
jgi:CRP/FNR family cyclic AMP-dependent transcriptional regulator